MHARAATATTSRVRIRWTAGDAAGLAHAHRSSWPTRTACLQNAIDERFAWPTRARCPACLAVIDSEGLG
jgi:hypothetical protein